MDDKNKFNMGDDNTFYGNVPPGNYGNGNTIIGPTDNNGNTIINKPMAVGRNAKAGPGSIAIGANAGAGSDIFFLLNKLEFVVSKEGSQDNVVSIRDLIHELKNQNPDKGLIEKIWNSIKVIKWGAEATVLVFQIGQIISSQTK